MTAARWTSEYVAELIAKADILGEPLSVEAVEALMAKGRIREFARDATILHRHGSAPKFFLALAGTVRLTAHTQEGKEYVSIFMQPGNFWGVHPCLNNSPETHDSIAETDCTLCVVEAQDIRALMWENREIQQALIEILCKRLSMTLNLLEQFATWGPKARMAWRILEIVKSHGVIQSSKPGTSISIAQDAIASMIGLSRQRANMILKEFEREGALKVEYGGIRVLDVEQLEAILASQ